MRNTKVASVQFESKPGEKPANLAIIRRFVESVARQRAEIIAFPECCLTGYWFLRNLDREKFAELAEPVFEGPSSQALMAMSRKYVMSIGAGFIEQGADGSPLLAPHQPLCL